MSLDFVKLSIEDLLGCINNEENKVIKPPHNNVKDEFDKFVNNEIKTRRKNSTISSMRGFHNFIKETLIINIANYFKPNSVSLLDIAVGRGGDMFKWSNAGISNVYGFDKSDTSINSINPFDQGAKERYSKSKKNISCSDIVYNVGDAVQPTVELMKSIVAFMDNHGLIKNTNPGFEIISCQFAMHYFFKSKIELENVFQAFIPLLKKGGYFIGTTVNGANINKLSSPYKTQLLEITKSKPKKDFGSKYTFKINDSVDQGNYFNTIDASVEYIVDLEVLKKVAKKHGLKPIYLNFFETFGNDKIPLTEDFVSFENIYNLPKHANWKSGKINLSDDELLINNLYTTFIFKKL